MNVSAEESLWLAFPVLLVIIGLVGGILFLQNQNTDIRSRASQPATIITPTVTLNPTTQLPQTPEIVCAEMYSPVCGSDKVTYANACEANLVGVINFTPGSCATPSQIPLPQTN